MDKQVELNNLNSISSARSQTATRQKVSSGLHGGADKTRQVFGPIGTSGYGAVDVSLGGQAFKPARAIDEDGFYVDRLRQADIALQNPAWSQYLRNAQEQPSVMLPEPIEHTHVLAPVERQQTRIHVKPAPTKCHVLTQFLTNSAVNVLAMDLIKHVVGMRIPFPVYIASSITLQVINYGLQRNFKGTERIERALRWSGHFSVAVSGVALLFAQHKTGFVLKVVNAIMLTTFHGASSVVVNLAGRTFSRMFRHPHQD